MRRPISRRPPERGRSAPDRVASPVPPPPRRGTTAHPDEAIGGAPPRRRRAGSHPDGPDRIRLSGGDAPGLREMTRPTRRGGRRHGRRARRWALLIAAGALAAVAGTAIISNRMSDETVSVGADSSIEAPATGAPSGLSEPDQSGGVDSGAPQQPEPHEPRDEAVALPEPSPPARADAEAVATPDDGGLELDARGAVEQPASTAPTPEMSAAPASVVDGNAEPDWEELSRSIVYLSSWQCEHAGSGTIVGDGTYVLTNSHVAVSDRGAVCDLSVGLTDRSSRAPEEFLGSRLVIHDPQLDVALLQMLAPSGDPLAFAPREPIEMHVRTLSLGEEIVTLGYPGVGGGTITITSGDYSGQVDVEVEYFATGRYWKTSAAMGPGISGGAAFDSTGRFVGIPTAGSEASLRCEGISQSDCTVAGASLGLILPADTVARWLEAHGYGDLAAQRSG